MFGGGSKNDTSAGVPKYEDSTDQDKKVVYYGNSIDPEDSNAVLARWKLPDDKYRVIFANFRTKIVGAEGSIKLQPRMLQKKAR